MDTPMNHHHTAAPKNYSAGATATATATATANMKEMCSNNYSGSAPPSTSADIYSGPSEWQCIYSNPNDGHTLFLQKLQNLIGYHPPVPKWSEPLIQHTATAPKNYSVGATATANMKEMCSNNYYSGSAPPSTSVDIYSGPSELETLIGYHPPEWSEPLIQHTATAPENYRVGATATVNMKEMGSDSNYAHQPPTPMAADIYSGPSGWQNHFYPQPNEWDTLFLESQAPLEELYHSAPLPPMSTYYGEEVEIPARGEFLTFSSADGCPEQEPVVTFPVSAVYSREMNGGTIMNPNAGDMKIDFLPNQVPYAPPVVALATPKPSRRVAQRWSLEEHKRFLKGMEKYGPGKWKSIAKFVETRSSIQVASHAQKFHDRKKKPLKGRRKSIHDITKADVQDPTKAEAATMELREHNLS